MRKGHGSTKAIVIVLGYASQQMIMHFEREREDPMKHQLKEN